MSGCATSGLRLLHMTCVVAPIARTASRSLDRGGADLKTSSSTLKTSGDDRASWFVDPAFHAPQSPMHGCSKPNARLPKVGCQVAPQRLQGRLIGGCRLPRGAPQRADRRAEFGHGTARIAVAPAQLGYAAPQFGLATAKIAPVECVAWGNWEPNARVRAANRQNDCPLRAILRASNRRAAGETPP